MKRIGKASGARLVLASKEHNVRACRISGLFESENGNLQAIFTKFLGQMNGMFTRTRPDNTGPANAYAIGTIGVGKGAYIYIAEGSQPGQEKMDAFFTIGEVFRLAGSKQSYSDEELSDIIHNSKFGEDYEKTLHPSANPFSKEYNPVGRNRVGDFSYYFHHIQESHCFSAKPQLSDY